MSPEANLVIGIEQALPPTPTVLYHKSLLAPDFQYTLTVDPLACGNALESLELPTDKIGELKILLTHLGPRNDITTGGVYDSQEHIVLIAGGPFWKIMCKAKDTADKVRAGEKKTKAFKNIAANPMFTFSSDFIESLPFSDSEMVDQAIIGAGNRYINYVLAHELQHTLLSDKRRSFLKRGLTWMPEAGLTLAAAGGAYYKTNNIIISAIITAGVLGTSSEIRYSLGSKEKNANDFAKRYIVSRPDRPLISIAPRQRSSTSQDFLPSSP